MKSRIAKLIITLALGCFAFPVESQTRPRLNGTWKMNLSRSRFGPREVPQNVVARFEQLGTTLRETLAVVNAKGTSVVSFSYNLDGQERINLVDGEEIKASAKWDGNALLIEWRDAGGTFRRRITFSDNDKTMIIDARDSNPDVKTNDLVVLEKQ